MQKFYKNIFIFYCIEKIEIKEAIHILANVLKACS